MKLSEVTPGILAQYAKTDEEALTEVELAMWPAAVSYVLGQTGMTAEKAEQYADLTLAALVVFCDFLDNRQLTVQSDKANLVVSSILGMYCNNLL